MSTFAIESNHGGDRLELRTVQPGEWRARIDFGDLRAEGKLYERRSGDELRLDSYFEDLEADWRGWDGDKRWESLGLLLAARHDGSGHVTLDVTLQQDYAMADRWSVRASLQLDAGGVGRLARAARALDAS